MTIVSRIEAYLNSYVVSQDQSVTFPVALWIAGTHCWQHFDAYPYIMITSQLPGSGKSTLLRLMEPTCHEAHNLTSMTPAAMFHLISDVKPVLLADESEYLKSESASFIRSNLNAGYERGACVERIGENGKVMKWDLYCPKAFSLMGHLMPTLRDRSIEVKMKRAKPPKRYHQATVSSEGHDLRAELRETFDDKMQERVREAYCRFQGLLFLEPRAEQIWTPLFVLCSLLCPDRIDELTRICADLAGEKTQPAMSYKDTAKAIEATEDEHYAAILLRNIIEVAPGIAIDIEGKTKSGKANGRKNDKARPKQKKTVIKPDDLVLSLRGLNAGPWRVYVPPGALDPQRKGLDSYRMGRLLGAQFNLTARPWRVSGKPERVYDLEEIKAKAREIGITEGEI